MSKYTFRLTAISPWFLSGAEPRGQPELRSSSVRGQLRYWLRTVLGTQFTNLKEVWEAESAVFGSTGQASAVTVRLYGKTPEVDYVPMMPHKADQREREKSRGNAISEGYSASLEIVTRPGVALPSHALTALQVWSLLGGIGKRSRRMFGAVELQTRDENVHWYPRSSSPDAFAATVQEVLRNSIKVGTIARIPPFPTLHPEHSWIIVGKRQIADPVEANVELFRDLLRTPRFRAHEQTFGQAVGGRRSSPLIAQVRTMGDGVIPVLTVMRSTPDPNIRWSHLCDFMEAAALHFDGVTVWGGRFA